MRVIAVAALWMATAAAAEDARLEELHRALVRLRTQKPLGDSPQLALVKHRLRDWIESQLEALQDFNGAKTLADRINKALQPLNVSTVGDEQNLLGTLGVVRVSAGPGMLIVTTRVGIVCQYDDSAYGYMLREGRWARVWESEQNDHSPKKYQPQHIDDVHVWRAVAPGRFVGPAFVMEPGSERGCASNWHRVYYRVWRVEPSGVKLLIDDAGYAYFRAGTIVGSINRQSVDENAPVDVLIEFTVASIDGGVHNREAVRHYLIDGDRVRRVDPVALSPRDFVDEWITQPWSEAAEWSASPTLQAWHRKKNSGEFLGTTMHCSTPDLWQVAIDQPRIYFLVRWRPPYRFTMADISEKPWSRCTGEDTEADAWRTLFNTQEWRW